MTEGQAPPPPPSEPPAPPPLPPPAAPPPSEGYRPALPPGKSFFPALFDFRFDNLVTPRVLPVVYVLMMIVLAIGYIASVVGGFNSSTGAGVAVLIFGPLVALLYLIIVRVYLELFIVAFKIRDAVDEVALNTRK